MKKGKINHKQQKVNRNEKNKEIKVSVEREKI